MERPPPSQGEGAGKVDLTVFDLPEFDAHEDVTFLADRASGLRAILAIHDTTLGPALGGCRILPYPSSGEALRDVLRLSRAMTFKGACAGIPFGGGKCVVMAGPGIADRPQLLEALGSRLAAFDGRFFLGEDVGTSAADMVLIHQGAPNVVGLPEELGGSGDPSPWTALGCIMGIRAAVKEALDVDSLAGLRVAVQGLGNVGRRLSQALIQEGASLIVTDVQSQLAQRAGREFDAPVVSPEDIYDADADIFAPCALGGVLNHATVDRLRAPIVAGCANNQLERATVGTQLAQRGILYAPDYVINAGGMIRLAAEILDWDIDRLHSTIDNIGSTLVEIFAMARRSGISTSDAADHLALERLHLRRAS
jgi:leucine dehydrogenase